MNSNEVKVFKVDDYNWMIGYDMDSCINDAVENYGVNKKDAEEEAYALSDNQLNSIKYIDFNGDTTVERTFAEQLQIEIEAGGDFPRLFACSEG